MAKKTWIQINGKLIPKEEFTGNNPPRLEIMPDIEPFQSPITGEIIRGRGHLRRHMKQHGVTNYADYGDEWFAKKQKENAAEQAKADKADRIRILKSQIMEK
jgi:glycine cleavage system H lipoate-binding protein